MDLLPHAVLRGVGEDGRHVPHVYLRHREGHRSAGQTEAVQERDLDLTAECGESYLIFFASVY